MLAWGGVWGGGLHKGDTTAFPGSIEESSLWDVWRDGLQIAVCSGMRVMERLGSCGASIHTHVGPL